jgi:pimeloyl-ACP methyl ester carboxylesterase
MLGYSASPPPEPGSTLEQEVEHLTRALAPAEPFHLVAHSLGAMFALHLAARRPGRVLSLTLVDPVVVSLLRRYDEAGYAEMDAQYQAFMMALPDIETAARRFVDHWNGAGTWRSLPDEARHAMRSMVPKIELEMMAARADTSLHESLFRAAPPSCVIVGGKTLLAARASARILAELLKTREWEIAEAAHMLPLTHAADVAGGVLERLRS